MNRADVASDVLDVIRACLGPGCEYKLAITRGVPPAGCNSVAAYWGLTRIRPMMETDCKQVAPCGPLVKTHELNILVTNICIGPDAGSFDWPAENKAAVCFWNDVELIERCLECNDFAENARLNGYSSIVHLQTVPDPAARGGGYAARIVLELIAGECCTP